jgi:plasmid stabilization system protein ParE
MIVVVSPQARDDISEAYRHLAANNPEAADHFLARIAEIIGMLAAGGVEGRFVQLGDGRTVQTWPIPALSALLSEDRGQLSGSPALPSGPSADRGMGRPVTACP